MTVTKLEEFYRLPAVPPGSPRYWSWLFAAPRMRDPLLGIYALLAEWRALLDPAVELAAAQLKLAWWREEIERLGRGAPVHPISRYIASIARAGPGAADFTPLEQTLEAAARQIGGAPLERAAELEAHAAALWAVPLATAARLAGEPGVATPHVDTPHLATPHVVTPHVAAAGVAVRGVATHPPAVAAAVHRAEAALAAADYLNEAIAGYRRSARFGRIVFPVDELLAATVEDADLCAAEPPLHLQSYLEELRRRVVGYCAQVSETLPASEHEPMRHLLVLAALGARQAYRPGGPQGPRFGLRPLRDLYLAWNTARRAARGQ
jgi:phytoene/squalene synthetase